jgi:hypothetical protein
MAGKRMRKTVASVVALGLLAALAAATAWSRAPRPPGWVLHGRYAPSIAARDFVASVDNRYFPLEPGTRFRYVGVRDGTPQNDDVVVTRRVKIVLGIRCTVVRDTVSAHGRALERTFDWYAQDRQGNVWYMGEDALELKNGKFVRASDSWQAGVRGAKAGVIMPANPRPGMVYRQEYYPPGGALDQAKVLSTNALVREPSGARHRALLTIEWSPVEPQLETKYYVAGIGELREEVVAGGHERFRLVSVTR